MSSKNRENLSANKRLIKETDVHSRNARQVTATGNSPKYKTKDCLRVLEGGENTGGLWKLGKKRRGPSQFRGKMKKQKTVRRRRGKSHKVELAENHQPRRGEESGRKRFVHRENVGVVLSHEKRAMKGTSPRKRK